MARTHSDTAPRLGLTLSIALFAGALVITSSSLPISAEAQMPADAQAQLCIDVGYGGEEFVLVGQRLSWSAQAGDDAREDLTRRLLDLVMRQPKLNVFARGRWVASYLEGQPVVERRNCVNERIEKLPLPAPPVRVALSDEGDLAALFADGRIFFAWPPRETLASGRPEARVIELPGGDRFTEIAWNGRRLVAAGSHLVVVMRPTDPSFGPDVRQYESRRQGPMFIFGGLTYMARESCWHIYVGEDLRPPVSSQACQQQLLDERLFVSADRRDVRVLSPAADVLASGPRPSIAIAQIGGNTRDVGRAILDVADLSARSSTVNFKMPPPTAPPEPWRTWLPTGAWPSEQAAAQSLIQIHQAWGPLRLESDWWTGRGVAVTWANVSDFVTVKGRSLDDIGKELTPRGRYNDAQVMQIIDRNRSLQRSLEGELISRGWIPIGAVIGRTTELPMAFDIQSALKRDAAAPSAREWDGLFRKTFAACSLQDASTTMDGTFLAQIRRGIEVVGGLDGALGRSLGAPTDARLRAEAASITDCDTLQLLTFDGAVLSARRDGLRLLLNKSIVIGSSERTYRAGRDEDFPVAVQGRVVVGVRLRPEAKGGAWREQSIRSWLDRIIRLHPRQERLLMPVVALRVALPGDVAEIARALRSSPNTTVLSAEAGPSLARGQVECKAADAAAVNRAAQEALMGLDGIQLGDRSVDSVQLAILENEMDLFNPAFVKDNKQFVWWLLNEAGDPTTVDKKTYEARPVRDDTDLSHGTAVAALLLGTLAPRGVIPGTGATWVDLHKSPDANRELFNQLAERGAVLNISQKLSSNWAGLETSAARADWSESMLFVAAAKNPGQTDYGMPLTWRTVKNVIGVGWVDANRMIPDNTDFALEYVDVLAPGEDVSTLDHKGLLCKTGTSFATAYVSAVTALLAQKLENRELSGPRLRARLLSTSRWDRSYRGRVKGGLVDVRRALNDLDHNLLTLAQVQKTKVTEGATLRAVMPENISNRMLRFEAAAAVGPGVPETRKSEKVPWFNVLRIQYTQEFAGKPAYRIAIVDQDDGHYKVYEDAVFNNSEDLIPLSECTAYDKPGTSVRCQGTTVGQIFNFIRRYPARLKIQSFR